MGGRPSKNKRKGSGQSGQSGQSWQSAQSAATNSHSPSPSKEVFCEVATEDTTAPLSTNDLSRGDKSDPKSRRIAFNGVRVGMKLLCRDKFQSKYTGEEMYKWRDTVVVDAREHFKWIQVHFEGWSDKYDLWLDLEYDWHRLAPYEIVMDQQRKSGDELDATQRDRVRRVLLNGEEPSILMNEEEVQPYAIGDKIDVQDFYRSKKTSQLASKWRKAVVVQMCANGIQIHYEGWDSKWDELINFDEQSCRIRPYDTMTASIASTTATSQETRRSRSVPNIQQYPHETSLPQSKSMTPYGFARQSENADTSSVSETNSSPESHALRGRVPRIRSFPTPMQASSYYFFADRMLRHGLEVVEVEADGNCLFRAVAHQMFLNEARHSELRRLCVQHMAKHNERFAVFCVGNFSQYLASMRGEGVWGDDLEIRALEEIFDRPIQIYSAESRSAEPLKTHFDEEEILREVTPIKLTYHGHSHYNSLRDERYPLPLPKRTTKIILNMRERLTAGGPKK